MAQIDVYNYNNLRSDLDAGKLPLTKLLELRESLSGVLNQYEKSKTDPYREGRAFAEGEYTPASGTRDPFKGTSNTGLNNATKATTYLNLIESAINDGGYTYNPNNTNNNNNNTNTNIGANTNTQNNALTSKVEGMVDNPSLPQGAAQTFTPMEANQSEFASAQGKTVEAAGNVATTQAQSQQVQQQQAPTTTTTTAATVADKGGSIETTTGEVSQNALVDPNGAMGSLSSGATVQYTQEDLDTRATIQGQMSSLFEGYAPGEIPNWAQPAVDLAQAQLSALGLSKSTIARDHLYNAVIGTALNIAQNDANAYKDAWLMNMETKYKVKMFNAANVANMDMQNASFAQQASIQNAQAFLQMDFKNMDNEQRTKEINLQAEQQRLLSDQAAENAARNFNAESTNQMNQFISQMKTTVDLDNAARADALSQFNATNEIDAAKFNEQMRFQVDSFNAQMAQAIEQSNIEWRREINTTNTAGINAVNQANATNMFNISNQALTFMWQAYRDDAYWAWMSSENDKERQAKIAMSALTNETMADQNQWDAAVSIGSFVYDILNS